MAIPLWLHRTSRTAPGARVQLALPDARCGRSPCTYGAESAVSRCCWQRVVRCSQRPRSRSRVRCCRCWGRRTVASRPQEKRAAAGSGSAARSDAAGGARPVAVHAPARGLGSGLAARPGTGGGGTRANRSRQERNSSCWRPSTAYLPARVGWTSAGLAARLDTLAGSLPKGGSGFEVHIVSDFQASAMPARFNALIDGGRWPVTLHPVGAPTDNWAVESVRVERDAVVARVASHAGTRRDLLVSLRIAGAEEEHVCRHARTGRTGRGALRATGFPRRRGRHGGRGRARVRRCPGGRRPETMGPSRTAVPSPADRRLRPVRDRLPTIWRQRWTLPPCPSRRYASMRCDAETLACRDHCRRPDRSGNPCRSPCCAASRGTSRAEAAFS